MRRETGAKERGREMEGEKSSRNVGCVIVWMLTPLRTDRFDGAQVPDRTAQEQERRGHNDTDRVGTLILHVLGEGSPLAIRTTLDLMDVS